MAAHFSFLSHKLLPPELSRRPTSLSASQDDHLLSVFSFLDAHQLWCFLCCCRHFHRIACEDVLWRALLTKELGAEHLPGSPPGCGGWRRRFWQWQRLESCLCTPRCRLEPAPTVRASAR